MSRDGELMELRGRRSDALERFERMTAWPMLLLSLAIIPLLVIPIAVDLSRGTARTFDELDWVIWAAFAAEYGIRLYLAPSRGSFFRHNLLDLVVVLLPFLRPLRVMRSARALRLLRAGRAMTFLGRAGETVKNILTRHGLHYALLIALLSIVGGATLVWSLERHTTGPTAIRTFGDAIWWAVTTVATVGYGDKVPTTAEGRGVAVLLMMIGIGVFGLLAASLASLFVEQRVKSEELSGDVALARSVSELAERLDRIEHILMGVSEKDVDGGLGDIKSRDRSPGTPRSG